MGDSGKRKRRRTSDGNLLEQGLTQEEVGVAVGVSQVDVSRTKTRLKKRLLALCH